MESSGWVFDELFYSHYKAKPHLPPQRRSPQAPFFDSVLRCAKRNGFGFGIFGQDDHGEASPSANDWFGSLRGAVSWPFSPWPRGEMKSFGITAPLVERMIFSITEGRGVRRPCTQCLTAFAVTPMDAANVASLIAVSLR
jgi:hypothetical protein